MKRIVIKEIDRLKSKTNKTKIVSEYLIYVMLNHDGEDIKLKAFSEIGEENKISRINQIILEDFTTNETLSLSNKHNIIQEITFEETLKNF
jgi:hypothetical protein